MIKGKVTGGYWKGRAARNEKRVSFRCVVASELANELGASFDQ